MCHYLTNGLKIVPSSSWTMEKRGTKCVDIAADDDKQQINALFTCKATGHSIDTCVTLRVKLQLESQQLPLQFTLATTTLYLK